jgi:late competence protein required for DNA uptake (superfamily II DNA/RNA helicase)
VYVSSRYWCCFSKYTVNSRVCIVTGPRIDLAEDLIARFKGLFTDRGALYQKSSVKTEKRAQKVALQMNYRTQLLVLATTLA